MRALSELLKKISDREKLVLDEYQIEHGPTIGKMYEGLTKQLLDKFELDKFGVKVVSGFMRVGAHLSGQIDCMIVFGEGESVPYTGEFIYPIGQVLAVIEVKKTLLAGEMADAYGQLNEALRLSKMDTQRQAQENTLSFSSERAAAEYMWLFGELAPRYEDNQFLPFPKRLIYHTLVRDSLTPVRIAIGYNGYKREQNLRNNFGRLFDGKAKQQGYGVVNFPNLMISGNFSVIKTNGMPYKGVWVDDRWGCLATSTANPLLLILELLYDRIELAMDVSVDRGLDLEDEGLYTLMLAKPVKSEQGVGWDYSVITTPLPEDDPRSLQWTPLEISRSQVDLLVLLREHGRLPATEPALTNFKIQYAIEDVYEFAKTLLEARLLLNSSGTLSIGSGGVAVVGINGRFYCGETSGGRFDQWIAQFSSAGR